MRRNRGYGLFLARRWCVGIKNLELSGDCSYSDIAACSASLAATFKIFQQPRVQVVCTVPKLDIVAFWEFGRIFIPKRECTHMAADWFAHQPIRAGQLREASPHTSISRARGMSGPSAKP